jgi:hypothetical protein
MQIIRTIVELKFYVEKMTHREGDPIKLLVWAVKTCSFGLFHEFFTHGRVLSVTMYCIVEELELGLKKFVFIQILINLKYAGIKYWIKKKLFS